MKQSLEQCAKVGLFVVGVLLLAGCPPPAPPPANDTTPPQFLEVLVRLEAPTPPNPHGEFNITSTDVTKAGIGSNLAIRILATAGDSESGIMNITPVGELRWRCAIRSGSEIIGVLETAPLTFTPASASTPPSPPVTPWKIEVVTNPIAATGCSTANTGAGPVDISGFVRATATSRGGTTTSKTFIFDYADVGVK